MSVLFCDVRADHSQFWHFTDPNLFWVLFLSFLWVFLTRLATIMHRVLELGSWGDQGSPTDNTMPAPIKALVRGRRQRASRVPLLELTDWRKSVPCYSPPSISVGP